MVTVTHVTTPVCERKITSIYRFRIGDSNLSAAAGGGITVTFHGVRGSTPCHGPELIKYGGNTSCVSLDIDGADPFLFDLGTGLRYFGNSLPSHEAFSGTCLLSHLHWDHIQGVPFFTPMLKDGSHVAMYAPVQEGDMTVEQIFAETIKPPLFPVHLWMLPGVIEFNEIWNSEFSIGDVEVMSRSIPHVGNTVGYRVTAHGSSVAYLSDHQMPHDGSFTATDGALELCGEADLVIHDAQYTMPEFAQKRDWGHCTTEYAIWLAAEAGATRLALFHHDPSHNDDMMDRIAESAAACGAEFGIEVFTAREGLSVRLGSD